MIADRTTGRTVESTLAGEAVSMGISIEDMPHIMNLLTDIYSDQPYAALREYVTNAYDAMVEAGVKPVVEVSLPTRLSPFLRIKDKGTGMDADAIRKVYSQYGRSTKRGSNDFNGMLGIGGKAALTYTDQFTVISRKNGHTIQVSVSRAASGAGVMQVVTDTLRDGKAPDFSKPSGTEVIIPAKVPNPFAEKAAHLFGYWKPGTVLVDGKQPEQAKHLALVGEPGEGKDGDVWIIDGTQSYIVMGNVPYKADIAHDLPSGYDYVTRQYAEERAVACFVPIGAVNFPPSREEVMSDDRKTRETLAALSEKIAKAKPQAVQRQIDKATDAAEAIQALLVWTKTLGMEVNRDYKWRGNSLPKSWEPSTEFTVTGSNGSQQQVVMLVSDNGQKKLGKAERKSSLPVGQWHNTLIAHGYNRKGMTVTQKKKLQQYVTEQGLDGIKRFALTAEKPSTEVAPYIGSDRIVAWETVNALKLPTVASQSGWTGRLPGSYDLFEDNEWKTGVAGDNIDRTKPIFYVHGSYSDGVRLAGLLTQTHPQNYVVCLSANRIDKFCRIIPAAKTAREGVKEAWATVSAGFSAAEKLALHIDDQGQRDRLKALDPARIEDPALRAAINAAKVDIHALETTRAKYARAVDTSTLDAVQWDNPLDSYPMFQAVWSGGYYTRDHRDSDDMYLYLNAKFQADQAATTKKGA